MEDVKQIKPPMTAEELKDHLSKGKVVMAESALVDHYEVQIRAILLAVGKYMTDDEPEDWVRRVFVSDMSSVSDFNLESAEVDAVAKAIGIPFHETEPLFSIAARMAGTN